MVLARLGSFGAAFVAVAACNVSGAAPGPSAFAPRPAASAPRCPAEMSLIHAGSGDVCIDDYEAAIEGHHFSEPVDGLDPKTLRAVPAKGAMPQVNVSEVQAEGACAGASKRLCAEVEWRAACQGPDGLTYPYGRDHEPGVCNEGKPRPPATETATRLDDPKLAEVPGKILPSGSMPRCVSHDGAYDMNGNVHEWVSTGAREDDPRYGMFLGGYFADATENGPGCTYKTTAHFKDYRDYSIGFRCCASPF
jgi:sulfatase modifying factor 1